MRRAIACRLLVVDGRRSQLAKQPWAAGGRSRPPRNPPRQLPRLRSLVVSHHGAIVLERYFNGARATEPANIKSASKSVIAALVGIAIAKGPSRASTTGRPLFAGAGERSRSIQARHHDRRPADDALGARIDQRPRLRRLGPEQELGALRAVAAPDRSSRVSAWNTAPAAPTCFRRS